MWPSLPKTFVTAQVYALTSPPAQSGYSAIVIGTEKSGASSAYILTPTSVTPVTFRATRTHAASALLPNGSLAVVGGTSGTLESFIP